MVFNERNVKLPIYYFLIVCGTCTGLRVHSGDTQDQTSSRPNTLSDDADDIQRQLDNEARDRLMFGKSKTIWILNIPTQIPLMSTHDWLHRRPRNPVTLTSCKNNIVRKQKSSNNNGLEPKQKNKIQITPDTNDNEKDIGLEPNTENAVEPSNVKNDLELPTDDTKEMETKLDVKNDIEPEELDYATDGDLSDFGLPIQSSLPWSYKEQEKWVSAYPQCGLRSQSPVDLPSVGLVKARGARALMFINYDAMPLQLSLKSDGKTVTLLGEWEEGKRPVIYGGASHSRRYRFHSMTLHSPSEHSIEKMLFALETQVLHVSTDYANFEDAVKGSKKDPMAFLGIINIYKFGCKTEPALKQLLDVANVASDTSDELRVDSVPLSAFCPPFGRYACYHGSLSIPPCTESVLWLVRERALPLERAFASTIKMSAGNRMTQPLNDRRVYLFGVH